MEREPSSFVVGRRIMEDVSEGSHRRIDTARPTLGFPLGTALILLIVFGVSALFSCCYHWEKIRSMHSRHHGRNSASSPPPPTVGRADFVPHPTAPPFSSSVNYSNPSKNPRFQQQQQARSSFPVVMPGDNVAKFIACPSPHGFAPLDLSDMAAFSQTNKSHT